MNRRFFLERVIALIGISTAAPAVRAADKQSIELQHSPVAGFQYNHGESLWSRLTPGLPLGLVREPNNPYDSRAVRIEFDGVKIGYVPRAENSAIAHLMDAGRHVSASVVVLRESSNPWDRIEISLSLNS
jgi:hypothetical protein